MSRYTVTVNADSAAARALAESHGYTLGHLLDVGPRASFAYLTEGASSSEVIDRVFAQLEQVGAKPAGVRVSVRPVEVVKP